MHALYVRVSIDKDRWDEAQAGLHEMVVPMVSAQPGFVNGTWLHDRESGGGVGVAVFDSEETARNSLSELEAQRSQPENANAPVTIEAADVWTVAAQA